MIAFGELPAGKGRADVERLCVACHRLSNIERSAGYSEGDWKRLLSTMIDLSATPALEARITGYLATHYPPNDRRTPVLFGGPVELAFESWQVPTLGQRSRDPVEAPDGSIWWTGQSGNLIGRLDPETGAMTEVPLPDGTFPHSVSPAANGDIWYLGNKNGTVGVVDGETLELKQVYRMPEADARDPHTGEFDQRGRFFFTLQHSNKVGRIDPADGSIKLTTLDRPRSRPYGIKIDAEGYAWVACNGGPCLYRIHPETLAQERIDLPNQESHVRRLDIDDRGLIWYVNSGAGRLGSYDPNTARFREWPSPSGPDSHPYGLVVVDGIVWYNESGKRPDPLVRFDPATETFQSWPIPSSGVYAGILRHTRADRAGRLLIHQSATNHILRVSVAGPSR
ncbi:MAG: cytochrome C [Pseudomonadota bacterium]